MTSLYNEIDPAALAALAEVMADEIIAPGRIEPRSIKELTAYDIEGYTQVHLFAGAGSWSLAARLAGWPDDWPIWTVSCPCQPFSQAGKRAGVDDPRHLWPDVFRLARAIRPPCLVGEQVAGAAGRDWFNGVRADLGSAGYAARVVDVPAAAVDAPHIRQRLYWVAVRGDAADAGCFRHELGLRSGEAHGAAGEAQGEARERERSRADAGLHGGSERNIPSLVHAPCLGWGEGRPEHGLRSGRPAAASTDAPGVTLGDAFEPGLEGFGGHVDGAGGRAQPPRSVAPADGGNVGHAVGRGWQWPGLPDVTGNSLHDATGTNGPKSFWSDHDWLICHDGKARRVPQSALRDVAHGIPGADDPGDHARRGEAQGEQEEAIDYRLLTPSAPGRIDAWKIAGNAIVAPLAVEVIAVLKDVMDGR